MLLSHRLDVFIFTLVAIATASPVNTIARIRCHCINLSTLVGPIACRFEGAKDIGWSDADSISKARDIKLVFASQDTVSKIRAVAQPLPTTVLLRLETPNVLESGDRIICGLGDEVKRMFSGNSTNGEFDIRAGVSRVEMVMVVVLLMAVLYVAGESIWTRYLPTTSYTAGLSSLLIATERDTSKKVESSLRNEREV